MASLPASTAATVYTEAGPVAGRYGVDADDLAHRVIEKFIDHRRSCSRTSCSTCDGQIDTRFLRRSLKNEAIDIRNELKMRGQRETDAARPELSTSSDPAVVIEADETEELLKYSASDLARLREHDRGWYDAFLLHSLGRSHREIAEILSLSIANSQQQVSRARKYLSSLRRQRLLTMLAVGAVVLGLATTVFIRSRAPAFPSIPLEGVALPVVPLPADDLPWLELPVADLVSTPVPDGQVDESEPLK